MYQRFCSTSVCVWRPKRSIVFLSFHTYGIVHIPVICFYCPKLSRLRYPLFKLMWNRRWSFARCFLKYVLKVSNFLLISWIIFSIYLWLPRYVCHNSIVSYTVSAIWWKIMYHISIWGDSSFAQNRSLLSPTNHSLKLAS